jgi:hypothetical protein
MVTLSASPYNIPVAVFREMGALYSNRCYVSNVRAVYFVHEVVFEK